MARQRHLNNAPIVEAIIDLRAKLASGFDVTAFAALKEPLHATYPKSEERREIAAGFEVAGKQVQHTFEDKGLHGYLFRSDDDKKVAQYRRDGFTFSRLKPYTEWEIVLTEAKRLWELYAASASPELVTRIAVRYVNQLGIPLPIDDFADYLTSPPSIPRSLPQEVSHFMTRMEICDPGTDIRANIVQALQKGSKPNEVNIILDIDVYQLKEGGFEDNRIWLEFEKLRELKNRIFFDSITERTASLFE